VLLNKKAEITKTFTLTAQILCKHKVPLAW